MASQVHSAWTWTIQQPFLLIQKNKFKSDKSINFEFYENYTTQNVI